MIQSPTSRTLSMHASSGSAWLQTMKRDYLDGLVAPMDGMWEAGFVGGAPHWEIRSGDDVAGYCAVTSEGVLLQFYVRLPFIVASPGILNHVISERGVSKAVASTADPAFLSICLDRQKTVTVHTILYQMISKQPEDRPLSVGISFDPLEKAALEAAVAFQLSCLDDKDALANWLQSYSGRLIDREELLLLRRGDEWLGLGEFRRSESQPGVVDLGMMVGPEHRRRGWGTTILSRLATMATAERLRPICSTTVDNQASQQAILRAGFVSCHRMMDVTF